jgi:hypothetical protein
MLAITCLTPALEREILDCELRPPTLATDDLVARIVVSLADKTGINVHIRKGKKVPVTPATICEIDADAPLILLHSGRSHHFSLANDYGIRPPSGREHLATERKLQELVARQDPALVSLYQMQPSTSDHSVMGVLACLLPHRVGLTGAPPLELLHSVLPVDYLSCPDASATPFMHACLAELARTVRSQYEAIVTDATVITNPYDYAWKTKVVTKDYSLPTYTFAATSKTVESATKEALRLVGSDDATTAAHATYAQCVRTLYEWAVPVAARWRGQAATVPLVEGTNVTWIDVFTGKPSAVYSQQELDSFPTEARAGVRQLVALATSILVASLHQRLMRL